MPRTILIVDDHEPMRAMLAEAIMARGYDVLTAANGGEGLALAATHAIDCVVTDVDMPGMDGVAFCSAFGIKPRSKENRCRFG